MINPSLLLRLAPVFLVFVLLSTNGCKSGGEGADFFGKGGTASITIKSCPLATARQKTIEVFQQDGFKLVTPGATELVFDKPGSNWDKVAYGTWLSPEITIRAPVKLSQPTPGDCRLECHPMLVRGKTDDVFADEFSTSASRTSHIQDLLNKVASQVNGPNPP